MPATYATRDPSKKYSNATLSNGNLTHTCSAPRGKTGSTIGVSSGKRYWEVTVNTNTMAGILPSGEDYATNNYVGDNGYAYWNDGTKYHSSFGVAYGATYTTGDIIGIALNMDAGTLTFYKNGVSQGVAFTGLTGTWYAGVSSASVSSTTNFGASTFSYSVPSGYNPGLYTGVIDTVNGNMFLMF